MRIELDKCKGCGICEEACPLDLIRIENKKVVVGQGCVDCKTCMKVCPQSVFSVAETGDRVNCNSCAVACAIPEGHFGACKRYYNEGGRIERKARLHTYDEVQDMVEAADSRLLDRPLLTGIGSGTTYPCFRPSPFIVTAVRDGVEIVTVVTEAPLSYSGIKIKIDTDHFLGEESKSVFVRRKGKRRIGHLCTEEYGSKILSLGGVNTLTGKDGQFAARTIFEFLKGEWIKMEIEDGSAIEIALGRAPKINGETEEKMRVGCGSAVSGLFAPYMEKAADEAIVLDGHITALFSEHPAGKHIGKPRSGISVIGQKSTDGRYFVGHGEGWGGTGINDPLTVVSGFDRTKFTEGKTLLVTETTGRKFAFFRMENGKFVEEKATPAVQAFLDVLRETCEESRVSAVFAAGVGGSARAGVTTKPVRLTRAVHAGKVALTIGGARPFIFPGGGINFLVDVEKIKYGSVYLSPTPSFIIPVEYTMRRETYREIGGHIDAVRPIEEVLPSKP